MGVVYRARDVRLDRDVAVKVLTEKLANDPGAINRFEKEAKAIAALSHPNILAIHDFDRDRDLYYVVTEYLEGDTLRSRMDGISWKKAAEFGIEISKGLAAAHSKGVVHRDLKPENIFITSDGSVKILDFGLAQMRSEKDRTTVETAITSDSTETQETVLGTVGYMSPEQVRTETVDARTDIFSLGCILFEMLAGQRPFAGQTLYEIVAKVLREDPPEISASGKRIPVEFQRLIRHCLEKNPQERFQSAQDVAYNLKTILNLEDSAPNSTKHFLGSSITQNRQLWLTIFIVLLAVSGLLFYLSRGMGRVRSLAVVPFANLTQNAEFDYLGEGISESVIYRLSQLPSLKVIAPGVIRRYQGADNIALIRKDLNVDAILMGTILRQDDQTVIRVNLVNARDGSGMWGVQYARRNEEFLSLQADISREITHALDLQLSGEQEKRLEKPLTASNDAYRSYLKGRYHWNRRSAGGLNQARQYFQEAIEKDPLYALAYAGLADCYAMMGSYDLVEPVDAYSRARAAAEKALEIDDDLSEAHNSLAHINMYYWDWPNAEAQFERAIELKPNYAVAHQWYANYLAIMGRNKEAIEEARRAFDLDPLSLSITVGLGRQYYLSKQFDGAIDYFQKALELDQQYAPAYSALGQAYVQTGRFDLGLAAHKQAIQLSQQNPDYVAMLAYAYALSGNAGKANILLTDLQNRDHYVSPVYVAMVYTGLKKKDQAFAFLDKAHTEHSEYLSFVKVEPEFDPLRSDQRYKKLMNLIGL